MCEEKNKELSESIGFTLVTDAWTNIRSESIIDIIICTPRPLFHKSIATGDGAHSGEEMFKDIDPVIEELGRYLGWGIGFSFQLLIISFFRI